MTQKIKYEDQSILVVDDNHHNALVIKLILKEYKIGSIHVATSARKAYEILESHDIDAILLDIMMPEVDGIEACAYIRKHRKYDLIPILMITADKGDYTLRKSFENGANDFIEKPVNGFNLMGRLDSQLKQRIMEQQMILHSRSLGKNEMTSMLAHQWRQPLSHITTLTSTIQVQLSLDKISKEETIQALKKVEGAVLDLSEMISNFTNAFSSQRIKSSVELYTLIADLIREFQPLLDEYGIKFENRAALEESFEIDKQSLQQVLINLITNSIDAIKGQGIAAPLISIETDYSTSQLVIKVTDNGIGIAKEDIPRLFEPYFSTKEQINGKGLGLYIAQQLVNNNLNGDITVASENGLTTATIVLTITPDEAHNESRHP